MIFFGFTFTSCKWTVFIYSFMLRFVCNKNFFQPSTVFPRARSKIIFHPSFSAIETQLRGNDVINFCSLRSNTSSEELEKREEQTSLKYQIHEFRFWIVMFPWRELMTRGIKETSPPPTSIYERVSDGN